MALWIGLSFALDLTFHLHPAIVGLAVGWGYRRGDIGGPNGVGVIGVIATTAALVAAGSWAIAVGGRGLDEGWFVALVAAVGLVAGLMLYSRGGTLTGHDARQKR